ncbi:mannose-ethanolamine phosphotransferase [Saccharomycopsis crataegensis]|uniref:Mannose-ethanolamine phosphotransferase n=1 Tax=Saccharomycopsis crataegensis TaxID=43959 RepID=A0AAV5QIJ2_9ASCO|nr:mannose-ethanolamine phosphotransferase [Saccharomycopsis crataegensis]
MDTIRSADNEGTESSQLLAYQQREKKLKSLRQQALRRNSRLFKLKRSNALYFCNLVAIFVLQGIAIYFFKLGFLLSRSVLPNTSNYEDLSNEILHEIPLKSIEFYHDNWGNSDIYPSTHSSVSSRNLFKREIENSHNGGAWIQPKFNKSILIVIDALRFDFVIPINDFDPSFNPNYHNNFPVLYDMSVQYPENSLLFKFLADPPTTTLQRLKGLTTGSLPTFIDAGSNFDGDEINEDNLIYQFSQSAKKNVTLIGDDTWDSLFRPYLNKNMSWPYESLNVWDIHTVDNGVLEHIFPLLDQDNYPASSNWQVIVGHFLGLDHVGHRYGPDNFEMVNKQKQMNEEMTKLIDSIDDDTLLVIMGDHGMDQTGNHGGDSKLELESTLFLYSKKPVFPEIENASSQDRYNLADLDSDFKTINQIDFVPSYSMLLGIPIPFNNLGRPVNEMHSVTNCYVSCSSPTYDSRKVDHLLELIKVNYLNILNLQRYKLALISNDGGSSPLVDQDHFARFLKIVKDVDSIDSILGQFSGYSGGIVIDTEVNEMTLSEENLQEVLDFMIEYQTDSLEKFKNIWAKFNNLFIYIGITLLAFSLLILVLLAKTIPSIVFNQLITEFLSVIILMIFFWLIALNATYFVLKPVLASLSFDALTINLLGMATGIISGFLIIIFDRYNLSWLIKQFRFFINDYDSTWSAIALVFIVIVEVITYSSNSFLIFQDSIINFLLINYGIYNLYVFIKKYLLLATEKKNKGKSSGGEGKETLVDVQSEKFKIIQGVIHSISFVIIQKLNSLIRTCREEQLNHCPKLITVTHGNSACQTTNNFTLTSLVLLFLVSLIFPNILRHFMNLNGIDSYQNSAQVWIGKLLRSVLLANCVYWLLDYIEFHPDFNNRFFKVSFDSIKSAKLTIARCVIGVCLIAGNFIWSKGPLCIKLVYPDESNENDIPENDLYFEDDVTPNETRIIGLNNIYGSSYLLLILNFLGAIIITNKPYSSISLMLLVYQIFNTLEILDILGLRSNMIGPIIFNLLGYSFFYSTNHQITISSIKWELAFQLSDSVTFPLSHIPILLNSFGPFIIVSLSVILITIWKIPPNLKPISLLSKIIVNCLTLLMSQTIITLSSLFFTNWFKRHLMVWKIFVPCFLFNSLILLVINFVIILVGFFFGVTKLIHQINRIFGK